MLVYLGYDHRGQALKDAVLSALSELGCSIVDMGSSGDLNDDYPDFAEQVAHKVAAEPTGRGILICHSGAGMAIAANKIAGIRAATADNVEVAKMIRSDDDANVLALASSQISEDLAKAIVNIFLTTNFDGGRHQRRVNKIIALEQAHA